MTGATVKISEEKQIHRPKQGFWVMNTLGWLIMGIINVLFQTNYFSENPDAYAYTLIIISFGFLFCVLFRWIILKTDLVNRKALLILPVLLLMQLVFALINVSLFTFVIMWFVVPDSIWSWDQFLGNAFNVGLVFSIWSLIYVGYLFVEQRGRLQEHRFELMLQLKEAELNNLRKQLSPHFLFNAINNIRSLVLIDPEKARQSLLDVSDLLRYALNYQKKELVSIEEEMEIVTAYINLNMIHLQKNAHFKIRVDKELEGLMIPPMSIQLLIENAVKHGKLINDAEVSVSVVSGDGENRIEVVNPGKLDKGYEEGIGLSNLQQRLEAHFGSKVAFRLLETDGIINAQIRLFK